ncbi:ABC transporter substrate-binding protein [Arsenicitalea aurantiaca]|nr:ABC transporter substrate-binding protein [Arsenicitalea aurantiaca]
MRHLRMAAMAGISFIALTGAAFAQDYQQAPMLEEMVASGGLPEIAERLGAEPRVMEPIDEIGQYGGTFQGGMVGGNDRNLLLKFTGYEPLLAWDRDWTGEVIPNVATGYSASEDSTAFTFTLREGMKWSDGSPFTADDIAFFIEDVLPEAKLFPTKPGWLVVDGELPSIEVISPTEFTISWSQPNGLFILNVAGVFGTQLTMLNKAYCSQFMPKYNDEAEANAAAAGVADWAEHMLNMCGVEIENIQRWRNPERPVIEAFRLTEPYVAGATRVAFERNPYYWKVDPEGNQLPYIDRASFSVNADPQTLVLATLAGDIHFESRHTNSPANLPLYVEGQEQGNFYISPREKLVGNQYNVSINLTHPDAAKREIFGNKDFRAALSLALDRPTMIDLLFFGNGVPQQVAPREGTPFYHEQLATQFTQYDVEQANAMLDEIGLDGRGGDGFRTMPDGSPLVLTLAAVNALGGHGDTAELVTQYWQAVGIDARLSSMDRTRFYEEKTNNTHDAVIWGATSGGIDVYIDPRDYFPFSTESNFAINWGKYYINAGGEEPPQYVKDQWALYDDIKATADPEQQAELFQQILDITAEQFYNIGISTATPSYAVVSNDLGNVSRDTPVGWIYPDPGPENPEQWYIKQ